ncbi:hypothetical protein HMI55_006448 [Coelomomyces lativittatus]|nr:hypothetical protein HMI55_006448 [Coelomomyces lativittatus]
MDKGGGGHTRGVFLFLFLFSEPNQKKSFSFSFFFLKRNPLSSSLFLVKSCKFWSRIELFHFIFKTFLYLLDDDDDDDSLSIISFHPLFLIYILYSREDLN